MSDVHFVERRSRRRSLSVMSLLLGAYVLGCNFDAGGQGSAGGGAVAGGASTGTTGEGNSGSDSAVGTGGGTAGGGMADGTETTTDMGLTTAVDDTTGPAAETGPCEPQAWFPDGDLDGFGDPAGEVLECDAPPGYVGQAGDCDDRTETINPDADELCNGLDDDCDGIQDEGSMLNQACGDCVFVEAADASRWFAVCSSTGTRDESRTACIDAFGPEAELARIDAAADQDALLAAIGGADHWLSLDDLDEEGVWRWHDGSFAYDGGPVGFNGWRGDQPVFGNGERCGELDAGGWADATCTQQQPRICEHPP